MFHIKTKKIVKLKTQLVLSSGIKIQQFATIFHLYLNLKI